jgi:hypothetical protein
MHFSSLSILFSSLAFLILEYLLLTLEMIPSGGDGGI